MKKFKLICATVTFVILTAISFNSLATDGYFASGSGTRSKALGGTGIAFLHNPFSAANNPAGIGFITNKFRFEIGFELFNPIRSYTVTGEPTQSQLTFGLTPGNIESGTGTFIIPTLAFSFKFGEKNTLGINIWGNGGMNTDYQTRTFYSQTTYEQFGGDLNPNNPLKNVKAPTGVNISQLFVSLTYARVLGEKHSIGISPIFVFQYFQAEGLQAFRDMGMAGGPLTPQFPDNSGSVTDRGTNNSTGFGVKIGYQGELFNGFRLGASVTPKIGMSEFEDYKGLFAEGGKFDIPLTWTAGISYNFTENFTLMFNVKQILYSDVKSIANPMIPGQMIPGGFAPDGTFFPNPNFVPLGSENGAGFGWDNMTMYKVGAEFRKLENWTFRLGYSYGKQPIGTDDVMFNILAPGLIENHITVGFTRNLGEHALNFAFVYALNKSVTGPNPFDPAQQIKIEMHQFEYELSFTF